jgi:hypothetical protein
MTTLTDREEITTTTTETTGRPEQDNRTLKAIVIALTVALLGLGAWVIIDRTSTPDTAVSDDVAQVWDDYLDAWNEYDGDAFLQVTTDDFTFTTEEGTNTADSQAVDINGLDTYDWQVTPIGERVMAGDGPWFVSQVHRVESNLSAPVEGISVLTIVDDGGVLRVASHTFFGDL